MSATPFPAQTYWLHLGFDLTELAKHAEQPDGEMALKDCTRRRGGAAQFTHATGKKALDVCRQLLS